MSDKVGYRVFTKVDRPDPALIERFRNIPTSNINDMMNRLYCMNSSIHQMNGHSLLGTAITVKAPIGDNLVFHRALDIAQSGDVLVVDGGGCWRDHDDLRRRQRAGRHCGRWRAPGPRWNPELPHARLL